MLLTLAWRNLWRNRSRTMITMGSVFFAVLLAILIASLQDGVYGNLIRNAVNFYTGYIQVHKNHYWDERVLDNTIDQHDTRLGIFQNDAGTGWANQCGEFSLCYYKINPINGPHRNSLRIEHFSQVMRFNYGFHTLLLY